MTQEEFRIKILALTETEQKIKNGEFPAAEFNKQVLLNAKKDERGYYYFTNEKMSSYPDDYDLRQTLSFPNSDKNLRLIIHTRFTETPFHYNEFISVQYVYSGQMTLHFTDHDEILTEGQLALINSDVIHSFSILFCEYLDPSVCSILLIENYMRIFFLFLIRGSSDRMAELSDDQYVISILKYLDEHSCSCSLNDLASRFNFSPKYISALLKKKTGKSFTELLTDSKMRQVRHLLRNTTLPVSKIALRCGYSNQTFFYHKFNELYHMSPARYREQQTSTSQQ